MKKRIHKKLIHEGKYIAEIKIELITDDEGWSPFISLEDAEKMDEVRNALRSGNLERASQLAEVYELTPVRTE